MKSPAASASGVSTVLALGLAWSGVRAEPGDLIAFLPLGATSPQDVAVDPVDGSFWVTTFLPGEIHHFGPDLQTPVEVFPSPFGEGSYLTGLAFDSLDGTLLVADVIRGQVAELERDGTPTGRVIDLPFIRDGPGGLAPYVRGMSFDPLGANGLGTIYFVEPLGTLIYEVTLDGELVRTFPHPEDEDGFPGEGDRVETASDVEPRYRDGALSGFWVTGGASDDHRRVLELDRDGAYTGRAVSLVDAGGNVSGILRREFEDPSTGKLTDSFLCVVESSARIALLEGGAPGLAELFGLTCQAGDSGVALSWVAREPYDSVEVVDACGVLATLGGDARSWSGELTTEGVHRLSVRAHRGELFTETPPCRIVTGPGRALAVTPLDFDSPADIAWDGGDFLLMSERLDRRVHFLDLSLQAVGEVPVDEQVADDGDSITAVARGREAETFWLYNTSRHQLARLNYSGEVLALLDSPLPDLATEPGAERDLGWVTSMTYDPGGDGGAGSLWLLEVAEDRLHEVSLQGELLRSLPHPSRDVGIGRHDLPFHAYSSGLSLGTGPGRLLVSGGALRELGQPRFLEVETATGAVVQGSEIPMAGVVDAASGASSVTFARVGTGDEARLLVLALAGGRSRLVEVETHRQGIAPPLHLTCRQQSVADDVLLEFTPGESYTAVEVRRDCEPIATLPPGAVSFVDEEPGSGAHTWGVRGVRGGLKSDEVKCELRVGVGALLQREFLWPVVSPWQMTRDPEEGTLLVVENRPGHQREVHRFDRSFRYLSTRNSVIEDPWEIATLAVRITPEGEHWTTYIAWKQPVPLGEAGQETFLLVDEDRAGAKRRETEIDPPRPTNGFVTFPTALAWEAASDTYWYLERNTSTFVHLAPDGSTIDSFPHPDPPFQSFVFNVGMAVGPEGSTLFITGSNRADRRVTRIMEMTRQGALTGREIPLEDLDHRVTGIALAGRELVAVGSWFFADLLRLKAFPEVPAPFVRGDADADGRLSLSDAILTLNHLFKGGPPPACEDAADADDSGTLSINDPVVVLLRLFLGGAPLPAPYPEPGQDTTPDGLGCRR